MNMPTEQRERYAALIAEFQGLDPEQSIFRTNQILAEAASLVDSKAESRKCAVLRSLYGKLAEERRLFWKLLRARKEA